MHIIKMLNYYFSIILLASLFHVGLRDHVEEVRDIYDPCYIISAPELDF